MDEGDGGGPNVVPAPIEYSCTRSESTGSGWNATSYDICREYGFIDRQVASSDCSQTGGVLTNGSCPRSSVAGYCPAGSANDIYYAPAECGTDPAFFGFVQGDPVNEACPGAWSCEAPPATSADAGEGSDCAPDDAQVLSCRYASQFEANNCADFPVAQGWDASTVESHCAAQQGADASTVAVVQDNSCLAERGPSAGSSRCQAVQDGKTWYAYGTPDFVCSSFISGSQGLSSGPFCDPY